MINSPWENMFGLARNPRRRIHDRQFRPKRIVFRNKLCVRGQVGRLCVVRSAGHSRAIRAIVRWPAEIMLRTGEGGCPCPTSLAI
jgi:hypothetical protein